MPASLGLEILSETAADLVENQPHQGLGSTDVGRRYHEIERAWLIVLNKIANAPIAAPRHLGDHGFAIEAEKGLRGREHA
jgi:hypothetical protein